MKSPDKIKSQVSTTIKNYGDNTLEKFGRGFRYSKFIKEIDDTDVSILGNNTTIKIQKRLTPVLSSKATYTVKFNTTLHHPHDGHFSITSSDSFTYYVIDDTGLTSDTVSAYLCINPINDCPVPFDDIFTNTMSSVF